MGEKEEVMGVGEGGSESDGRGRRCGGGRRWLGRQKMEVVGRRRRRGKGEGGGEREGVMGRGTGWCGEGGGGVERGRGGGRR